MVRRMVIPRMSPRVTKLLDPVALPVAGFSRLRDTYMLVYLLLFLCRFPCRGTSSKVICCTFSLFGVFYYIAYDGMKLCCLLSLSSYSPVVLIFFSHS